MRDPRAGWTNGGQNGKARSGPALVRKLADDLGDRCFGKLFLGCIRRVSCNFRVPFQATHRLHLLLCSLDRDHVPGNGFSQAMRRALR